MHRPVPPSPPRAASLEPRFAASCRALEIEQARDRHRGRHGPPGRRADTDRFIAAADGCRWADVRSGREAPATPRPWHRDLTLISGLVLLVLGAGNWITGSVRMAEHAGAIERTVPALAASPERARIVEAAVRAELEVARVRMDFYHVVASGGRLMFAAGAVLAGFSLARSLRGEARGT